MSEQQAEYHTGADEAQEAMGVLGGGYHDAPLEIHPETKVIRREGWKMVEEVVPAFVKISTAFKNEMCKIDPNALAVWLYIALSINRNTERAHPGIRTIADGCGLSPNTVTAAVKRLEQLGLLTVNREDRKYNIYEIPDYISANAKSVANIATPPTSGVSVATVATRKESVAIDNESVATEPESVAKLLRLNQINQINQSEPDINNKQFSHFIPLSSPEEKRALTIFVDRFGKFHGEKECKRWLTIVDAVGMEQAETIAAWGEKREIHMDNRPGLLDSLETAAKKWTDKPANLKGDNTAFFKALGKA